MVWTILACHLLRAAEGWTDPGFGDVELRYLRDKQKREVDFPVVRDRKPWFLVEVKLGETLPSQTKAAHAFQVVVNLPHEPADCFRIHRPVVVPANVPEPTPMTCPRCGKVHTTTDQVRGQRSN